MAAVSSQPLRTGTGFHTDQRRLRALEELQQCVPAEPSALDRMAALVKADYVEDDLTNVDSEHRGGSRYIANGHGSLRF